MSDAPEDRAGLPGSRVLPLPLGRTQVHDPLRLDLLPRSWLDRRRQSAANDSIHRLLMVGTDALEDAANRGRHRGIAVRWPPSGGSIPERAVSPLRRRATYRWLHGMVHTTVPLPNRDAAHRVVSSI